MNKIILRAWQKQDAQALAAIANNRRIWNNVRNALPNPYTVMDALQWISYVNDQTPVLNFAVVYNNEVVGSIGCTTKEDIACKTIEIGYFIGEPYWGKGHATESVKLLLDFIETRLNIVRIEAHVFASNKASMRVLHKNGFYLEAIHRKAAFKNNELIDDYVWVKFA